ncbi:hypothetical protein [Streptomyces lydicus]|uniref:hypothetical protein n=1 Tax=Streptomyces lydicus TaxID=47763 RepID=UPI0034235DA1
MSLRAVQYHFDSKHQLLVDALHLLHDDNERIARSRIDHDPADPRALLRAVPEEFLPVDAQRATALRVFAAYYARSRGCSAARKTAASAGSVRLGIRLSAGRRRARGRAAAEAGSKLRNAATRSRADRLRRVPSAPSSA